MIKKYTIIVLIMLFAIIFVACPDDPASGDGGDGGDGGTINTSDTIYISTTGNDSNPGTEEQPMATVQNAIDAIQSQYSSGNIYISEGTYEISETITAVEGISIQGGYSQDWSTNDPATYFTTIQDTRTTGGTLDFNAGTIEPNAVIEFDSTITSATEVSGLILRAGEGDVSTAVLCNEGSPTLTNNVIKGWNATTAYGMVVYMSSSNIDNNEIFGGISCTYSYGVYVRESTAVIQNNLVNGGFGTDTACGIITLSDNSSILYNEIIGGMSSTTLGIKVQHSDPTIIGNEIKGGSGTNDSNGIYNYFDTTGGNTITIINNTINGGTGGDSYGIDNYNFIESNSSIMIYNNTIDGGSGSNAYAVNIADSPNILEIKNNIIYTSTTGTGYGIYEEAYNNTAEPFSVMNNDIFNCSTALYSYYDSGSDSNVDITDISDVNGYDYGYLDNVSEDPALGGDDNMHLTASSPTTVTEGGITITDEIFPVNASSEPVDKEGTLRTDSWSMGAYELD